MHRIYASSLYSIEGAPNGCTLSATISTGSWSSSVGKYVGKGGASVSFFLVKSVSYICTKSPVLPAMACPSTQITLYCVFTRRIYNGILFAWSDWAFMNAGFKNFGESNYLDSSEYTISVSHVTRQFLPGHNARLGTTGSDVSWSSVGFRYTMTRWHSWELPSLHDSLKTSVHSINLIKIVRNSMVRRGTGWPLYTKKINS